ncbi:MAG: hypothetical protein ACYTGH_06315 [Planctomycetota bacterium]|jgi:hypothetical protein
MKSVLVSLAVLATFAIGGYLAYTSGQGGGEEGVFEYDLDALKAVDPKLISHRETVGFALRCEAPKAIAVGEGDSLYVGHGAGVIHFDGTGTVLKECDVPDPVTCLAVDRNAKRLYVGSKDRVRVYSLALMLQQEWAPLKKPAHLTSLAVAGDRVYAADAGRRTAVTFDRSGAVVLEFGRRDEKRGSPGLIIPSPYFDCFVDGQGKPWLVNPGIHAFERYAENGDMIQTWKTSSTGIEGFCGCCNPSHVALLPGSRIVTSEKGLVRIKIYGLNGGMESVVAAPDAFDDDTVGLDLAVDAKQRILALDPKRKRVRIFVEK